MSRALQVYLEDPEFEALRAWSKERGWTLSQSVRVAVKALTRTREEQDNPRGWREEQDNQRGLRDSER